MASKEKKKASPRVSFVVPCFKLGHLLKECVDSILSQTFADLEVLVMDDCSPDNTPTVANSFGNTRVRHIRNPVNLGHLRNYNKGIELAKGEYIWLISADDRLRNHNILEQYVHVMDANPSVGYAICPGIGIRAGRETGIIDYSVLGGCDRIIQGRILLRQLLRRNCVLAAAGMVRRVCYEQLGSFPLDLPYAGDWYLWCLFAMHFDVAYFSDPMVSYREHEHSMTNTLLNRDVWILLKDDLQVRWRMARALEPIGEKDLVEQCEYLLVQDYAQIMTLESFRMGVESRLMSLAELDESLEANESRSERRRYLRGRILEQVGDWLYAKGQHRNAHTWYGHALADRPREVILRVKKTLIYFGEIGSLVRRAVFKARGGVSPK